MLHSPSFESFASRSFLRRTMALCLALLLTLLVLPVSAAQPDAAVSKKEIIYAEVDASGQVGPLYVINRFSLPEENSKITDYGNYSKVMPLVEGVELELQDGQVTAQPGQAGSWYYQGILDRQALPWTFTLKMQLDGKDVSPEELSGASGHLRVELSLAPAPEVDRKNWEAFILQYSLSLDAQKVENIEAPGAMLAAAGDANSLNWMLIPGAEEQSLCWEADVQDFQMDQPRLAIVPLQMDLTAMLDKPAVSDKLQELLSGESLFQDLQDGVKQLKEGSGKLRSGSADLASALTELRDGSAKLVGKDALGAVESGINKLAGGSQTFTKGLQTYLDGVAQLAEGAAPLQQGLTSLSTGLSQLDQQGSSLRDGFQQVQNGLTTLMNQLHAAAQSATPGAGAAFDPQALSQQIEGFQSQLQSLAPLLSLDTGSLEQTLQSLRQISLPSADEQGQLLSLLQSTAGVNGSASIQSGLATLNNLQNQIPAGYQEIYRQALEQIRSGSVALSQDDSLLRASMGQLSNSLSALQAVGNLDTTTLSIELSSFRQMQSQLSTQLASFQSQLTQLSTLLAGLSQAPAGNQLQSLMTGLDGLNQGLAAAQTGLASYLDGLHQVVAGLPALTEGSRSLFGGLDQLTKKSEQLGQGGRQLSTGASDLQSGFADFASGLKDMDTGVSKLAGQYPDFAKGVVQLDEGLGQINEGLQGDPAELLKGDKEGEKNGKTETSSILDKLLPTYVPRSFVDPRNTNVTAVQFVLLFPGVEAPAAADAEDVENAPQDSTFWERVQDLFR